MENTKVGPENGKGSAARMEGRSDSHSELSPTEESALYQRGAVEERPTPLR